MQTSIDENVRISRVIIARSEHILSDENAYMKPTTLGALEFMKHWKRAGVYAGAELTRVMALGTLNGQD